MKIKVNFSEDTTRINAKFGEIHETGGTSPNAVTYTPQNLTDDQQAQARENIGAGDSSVRVSCTQPTAPDVKVWVNPCGAAANKKHSTSNTVSGIVGLALNEMLNNTAARYATIQDALAGASATADGKVLAYTCGGALNIMLLDNMESTSVINITKDCTLHLNGKTISFTAPGAYLNINTASEVTINGEVAGSKIAKSDITSSQSEKLVSTTGTHLTINGGTYSMTNITATFAIPIRTESTTTQIDMDGCLVIAHGSGATKTRCVQTDLFTAKNCTFDGVSENGQVQTATLYGKSYLENCVVTAKSHELKTTVLGVAVNTDENTDVVFNNCDMTADGWSDYEGVIYPVYAISAIATTSVTINGGHYWGARDALAIHGKARINGGVFEGCQHGGAYMSGTDIKAKNAIFRSVKYKGDVGWLEGQNVGGAIYCGSSENNDVNVYFDNCRFESNVGTSYGVVTKYSGAKAYLSNSIIDGSFVYDLRADNDDIIYIGKNVVYRPDKININGAGTIDTTTYADQEFGFETETTTSNAILSVKDERGNWVGIA